MRSLRTGRITVNDTELQARDGAALTDETEIPIVFIDVALGRTLDPRGAVEARRFADGA